MLTGQEFGQMFSDFEHSAYRLEILPAYRVPSETERLRQFAEGLPPEPSSWVATVRAATRAGKAMRRVRLVPELTEYLRFEFTWGYPFNSEAGEQISVIEPADVADIQLPGDYWLLDDRTVVLMHYDTDGTITGRELLDGGVEPYRRYRDLALARSTPWADWWGKHQG